MKSPTTTEVMMSEALAGVVILAGCFPKRTNTVRAASLALLLQGRELTGIEAVFHSSTTRLAGAIEPLRNTYLWPIMSRDLMTGCNDGRVSTVSVYYLLPSTIADAKKKGADAWCAEVRAARLKLRAKAAEAKRKAEAINAARRKLRDDRQADMFGGVAA